MLAMRPLSFRVAVGLCLAALPAAGLRADIAESIRVYDVRSAVFPYVFKAVVSTSGEQATLSFNHRMGRTYFVRVGEKLGEYTVRSYESRTKKVFSETLNTWREREAGLATLVGPNGNEVALEQGKPLPQPGHMACLVSLGSGRWQQVYEGEALVLDKMEAAVESVTEEGVTISQGNERNGVPAISKEEKQQLAEMWEAAARKRREELARRAEEEKPEPEPRQVVRYVRSRPRLSVEVRRATHFFGGDYAYPTEYQVIPVFDRDASGRLRPRAIVVPTKFERRDVGTFMRYCP